MATYCYEKGATFFHQIVPVKFDNAAEQQSVLLVNCKSVIILTFSLQEKILWLLFYNSKWLLLGGF